MFTLNGGAVSWKSSKQETTADSTTESEYIAASEVAKEAVWIKKLVNELGVVPRCRPSILHLNTCIYPMGVILTHRSHMTPLGPF